MKADVVGFEKVLNPPKEKFCERFKKHQKASLVSLKRTANHKSQKEKSKAILILHTLFVKKHSASIGFLDTLPWDKTLASCFCEERISIVRDCNSHKTFK